MFTPVGILLTCALGAAAAPGFIKRAQPQGTDVSSYQGNVAWAEVAAAGVEFAYIKATEGTCMRRMALAHHLLTDWRQKTT